MSEKEIKKEIRRIVGSFDGIEENEIEQILMTIAALNNEREVKHGGDSTHGERVFFTDLVGFFLEDCLKMMWKKKQFSREEMATILRCPSERLSHYYQKAVWNIATKPRWPDREYCLDANGKIAVYKNTTHV